jgi:energy-coupling factor transport system permease protein
MEARGFGAPGERTWARPSLFGAREWALVGGGLGVAVLASAVSVLSGNWNFVLG